MTMINHHRTAVLGGLLFLVGMTAMEPVEAKLVFNHPGPISTCQGCVNLNPNWGSGTWANVNSALTQMGAVPEGNGRWMFEGTTIDVPPPAHFTRQDYLNVRAEMQQVVNRNNMNHNGRGSSSGPVTLGGSGGGGGCREGGDNAEEAGDCK